MSQTIVIVQCGTSLEKATAFFDNNEDERVLLQFRQRSAANSMIQLTDELLQGFLDSIESTGVNIHSVRIDPDFVEQFASPDMITKFYKRIGCIRNLQSVEWFMLRQNPISCCLKPLSHVLAGASQLESLLCCEGNFNGTGQDFEDFASALRNHPNLQKIYFGTCCLEPEHQTPQNMLPIVEAISSIPNLQQLALDCWGPNLELEEVVDQDFVPLYAALSRLCHKPGFRSLKLRNSPGAGACGSLLMEALGQSPELESLTIPVNLRKEECSLLGRMLCTNTALATLNLKVAQVDNKGQDVLRIIEALRTNSSITSVSLAGAYTIYTPSQDVLDAIASMLEEDNMTLTSFGLPYGQQANCTAMIDAYIQLNRLGRKDLLANTQAAHKKKWVNILAKVSANPNATCVPALFYLLSQNPSICED